MTHAAGKTQANELWFVCTIAGVDGTPSNRRRHIMRNGDSYRSRSYNFVEQQQKRIRPSTYLSRTDKIVLLVARIVSKVYRRLSTSAPVGANTIEEMKQKSVGLTTYGV